MDLTCAECGSGFTSGHHRAKFCSEKCYVRYWNKNRHEKKPDLVTCAECKNEFNRNGARKIYCSLRCQQRARRKRDGANVFTPDVCKCEQCPKEFKKTRIHQRFCSKSCASEYYRQHKTHGICIECGIPFERTRHRQSTCSEKCAEKNKMVNRKYSYIDINKLNKTYKSAFTQQQQREITNIIGIGIAHIGNLREINADTCLDHIYNNIIDKLKDYKLYKQEIKHIYKACLIVLDIVRNHKGQRTTEIEREDIFKEMKSGFNDQIERVYETEND